MPIGLLISRFHRLNVFPNLYQILRDRAGVARWAHNPKVGGSNPSPATKQNA